MPTANFTLTSNLFLAFLVGEKLEWLWILC